MLISDQIMIKVTPQFIPDSLLSAFNHEFYLTRRFLLNKVFHHRSHSGNCITPGKDGPYFYSSKDVLQRQHFMHKQATHSFTPTNNKIISSMFKHSTLLQIPVKKLFLASSLKYYFIWVSLDIIQQIKCRLIIIAIFCTLKLHRT